jgi:hypothetical protein
MQDEIRQVQRELLAWSEKQTAIEITSRCWIIGRNLALPSVVPDDERLRIQTARNVAELTKVILRTEGTQSTAS